MTRVLRSLLVLLAAFTIGGTAVAVAPSVAGAASSSSKAHAPKKKAKKKKKPAKPPKPVTIAPGATVRYYNVTVARKRVVRSALLRFDVRNPRIALGASLPGGAVGAGRQTISTQTRLARAAAGINADFFDMGESGGTPKGGVIAGGVVYKTPRRDWDANFYVRNGRAAIGRVNFTGLVTRAARPEPEPTDPKAPTDPTDPTGPTDPGTPPGPPAPSPETWRTITSVNTVKDLGGDRIVLVTPLLARPVFGRACTVAMGATAADGSQVITSTFVNATSVRRLVGSEFALVACGTASRATWLTTQVATGDTVRVAGSLDGGTPDLLVSGGKVLVRDGRAFNDSDGKTINGRNPETFGCVSRGGTHVLLGTIDGRREGSSGVTLAELTRYLLRLKCWSGIVFDGGGSSTLVGQRAGTYSMRVLNRPSDRSGPRRVTTGLVLYRR